MSDAEVFDAPEGVAVVGMSGRFPGARSLAQFWENLRAGVESISFFSRAELEESGMDPALLSHPAFVNAGGVLDDMEMFDASFFGFSPREAEVLDPQQRVFMECAWHALEDAGYDPENFDGPVGVYGGAGLSLYLFNLIANRDVMNTVGQYQVLLGNDKDHLTTHVSYKLNLKGPSLAVQTACSTSLVAVCMACQSLLDHQCDMALAGGVGLKLPQKAGYFYQEGMINSPDGHCRPFDARAKGTVGGSGVGVVVLKRLSDALGDGDLIHAVIRGSAINNDGALKVGYTAPSVEGQAEVIAMAQAMADVSPETITYVEAHGTATPLGDPIEIAALTQAFRAATEKKNFCGIGSVKSNIGHLDSAAGVAGLIKTVLMLKNKMLPPSLHFTRPNPAIDFANSPFYVNARLSPWERGATPRRAGVSAFGIGGTNAHAVLEEAPDAEPPAPSRPVQLLLLSARTDAALETATANMSAHLRQHPDAHLPDVAYTCQVGRRAFGHRRMLVCEGAADAAGALETLDPRRVLSAAGAHDRPVMFMFPGQGAQHVDMARGLYRSEPTFRTHVDRCAELLRPILGQDLRQLLYPPTGRREEAARELEQTALTQPTLFVVEYALAQLWMEWGVRPQAMIGHSIGEYVAACLAGVFSLEDALPLVAARGRMMQEMPRGSMLVIPLPEREVRGFLNGNLDLAAVNAESLCVVSGPAEAVAQLETQLRGEGRESRHLHTSHAFHSRMMEPMLEPFLRLVRGVRLKPPQIPYVSNLTGTWVSAGAATEPDYWARHLRQTVRFAEGVRQLLKGADSILLEVGPGETLGTLVRQHPEKKAGQVIVSSMRRPQTEQRDEAVLLSALGRLWLSGVQIDWPGFYTHERRRRVSLPTYPFERQRYWVDARQASAPESEQAAPTLKRSDIADWFYAPSWKRATTARASARAGRGGSQARWLIFSDTRGVGAQLAERLRRGGQEVFVVTAGDEFTKLGDGQYVLNPREDAQYQALFKNLRAADELPQKIVHLWGVTSERQEAGAQSLAEAQANGFYSLLSLAQAFGAQNLTERVQLLVVSDGVQRVGGEERLQPEKATVLGPCKVIPQEYPNIACRHIDIASPAPDGGVEEWLVEQLIAEFDGAEASENVIAYRGRERLVQTFEPVRLESAGAPGRGLRDGGVYLITGGTGGIGLALAEYIAQTVKAKLVLAGRSGLPERAEWEEWLEGRDERDPVSQKIRQVRALEALGAEVLVASADVADREEMRALVDRTRERFGSLNGVVHSAGVAGGGMIQLKTRETAESVLAPKVGGTLALAAALEDVELDFLVLCSSLASVLGIFGQADYCGANAFLDAFAHAHDCGDGRRVVSVNWDTWQEVGMAVNTSLPPDLERLRGESLRHGMLTEEGKEVFERILQATPSQVVVSTTDLKIRLQDYAAPRAARRAEEAGKPGLAQPAHERPALPTAYVAARSEVEQTIAGVWQELFGVAPIGVYDNFFELGGHSLLAIQLVARLQDVLAMELSMRTIFDAPTVAELAERVERAGRHEDEDAEQLTRMLDMVEQLSESEINALLAEGESQN